MADNIGPYVLYDELIVDLFLSGSNIVSNIGEITLSNRTVDIGGDLFDYTPTTPTVKVGDVINQLGKSAIVKAILTGPDRIRVDETPTDLENGVADALRSTNLPRFKAEELIQSSSDFIDEQTGQFFNKRIFDDTNPLKLEGNNTPTMWFPVPIIAIAKLLINSTDLELTEGEDDDFVAFKGRARPQDDRRNPRLKLNVGSGRDNIFVGTTSRIFVKEALTHIEGDFGFLEPDGSTPVLIKKAVRALVAKEVNVPITSSSVSGGTGPLKRKKVDLHEEEFFELRSAQRINMSGIGEVDQIIAKYKAPFRIDGSVQISRLGGR